MRTTALLVPTLLTLACEEPSAVGDALDDTSEVEARTGELVFVEQRGPPAFRVAIFDLASGEVSTLFALPAGAFAYGLDVHPVTGMVLLAYTPPPEGDEPGFDRSVLVELREDGPHHVLGEDAAGSWALQPRWSADGEDVWYVALGPGYSDDALPHTLVRADLRTGAVEVAIPWATEPAVSPTGDYVAWVAVDPETWQRDVVMATPDGDPVRTLVDADVVLDPGLPSFSVDGRGVLVALLLPSEKPRAADLRAPPAPQAHGTHLIPADWYGIAIDDTELLRVSELATILYGVTLSRDDPSLMITATREGLDLVHLSTGATERLFFNRFVRAVAWRPGAGGD